MRISRGILASLAAVAIATPAIDQAMAQVGVSNPPTDIWQNGTQPVSGLSVARQTPIVQPAAPAQPASNQPAQAGYPSWYPQVTGTPVAGGTLYTGITVGTFYDDNVFATNTDRMGDFAFFERPEFSWFKQGQNYTLTTDGYIEGREYAKFTSDNQINGSLGASFTVMPDNNTQIVGSARYIYGHLDRGASETVITTPAGSQLLSTLFAHPVAYNEGIESVALNKRYGNWWSSVGAAGLEIDYQNPTIGAIGGPTTFTGTPVNLNYADGVIATGNGRLGYVVRPLTSVFVEAAGNTRDWQVGYFNSGGYRVDAGMLFEQGPGARLKGEFWGGYMGQQYNGVTMAAISSWTYGINLAAIVADNVTATIQGSREAKEAALGLAFLGTPFASPLGASTATCSADGTGAAADLTAVCVSTIESTIGGRLDFHVAPKWVLGGGATYLRDDYQGVWALGRVDNTFSPLASIKYLWSPNLTLAFDYRYVQFSSQGGVTSSPLFVGVNALPYDINIYMLSLNARW